jgi:PKD repeat protein
MGWDENYTHWQNFSISVANKAPSFSTTPSTIVWISLIYGYNPTTDDEGLGGYYALVWDLNLTVSFNVTTGIIMFNAQTAGVFLFNLTFDDGSGALNATVSQVWSVTVQSVGSGGAGGGGGPPINVDFTFKVNGNTVTFTVISKFTSVTVQYLWDFGDGGTSTLINPTHSYAQVGNYTVTLVIGSPYATLGSAEHTVAISEMSRVSSFVDIGATGQIFIPMMLLIGFGLAITTKHPLAIIVAAIFLLLTVLFVVVPFLSSIGSVI